MISPWTIIGWVVLLLLALQIFGAYTKGFTKKSNSPVCPKCGGRLDCLELNKKYYCSKCNKNINMEETK